MAKTKTTTPTKPAASMKEKAGSKTIAASKPKAETKTAVPKNKLDMKSNPEVVKFSEKLTDSLDDITGMINKHKDMIDSIQEVSLDLTELIGNLHEWAVKYAGIVNQVLDNLLPIIKKLPIVPDKVTKLLSDIEKYTQKLLDSNETTSKTIADVHTGLKTGNVEKIKGQSSELKKVAQSISLMLPD